MLFFHAVLTLFMLVIMVFDATRFIIPNWVNGTLLLALPAMLLLLPPEQMPQWQTHLMVFGCSILVGFVVFALRWMGGGDVKLLMVAGLWMGTSHLMEFLLYMGVIGGLISIVLVVVRPLIGFWYKEDRLHRIFHKGAPVPYGLAIAAGFLIVLWKGQIPGLPV